MMPNEQDKNVNMINKPTIHTTHQLPIDLAANKVIVKPANDNSKMSIQQTFRTIQQPQQMRVVRMPATGTGAQIIQTQIMPQTILKPPIAGRSTITVSKSPATYLPRVTAINALQGAKATQQIRTPTPPSSVGGISTFVRTSLTPRTSSPSAVLSQGTTAWVSGSGAMQVQVPQQIIRSTITNNRITANIFGQSANQQNSTISVSTATSGSSGQPTYVATVLPQRPQGATIVYTSQTQPPFIQGQVQRMGIATGAANTRQIRPIQRIPSAGIRVNTSSLSIRQNVPGLAPTTATVLATQPRNTTGLATSTTINSTIPARIFQVQSPAPGGSQVIGQSNQKILSANVMLPIIMNNRVTHSVKNPIQQGIIAHVSKLTTGAVSGDGNSITNTMSAMNQAVQVSQGTTQYATQASNQQQTQQSQQQQVQNQIITVSQQQQQQLINNQTVVPLAISGRNANIPIKTITVSAANESGVTVHRNLSSTPGNLQATTIMPIAKIVTQSQVVSQQQQTPVYIHTRIPTVSTSAATGHTQVISVASSTPSTATVYYEQASLTSAGNSDIKPASSEPSYSVSSNVRFPDKMIHSIIASSFQSQQNQGQASVNPIRYSPLVVEPSGSQSQQQQQHQIITQMASSIVQQQQQQQQQISVSSEAPTHMIVPLSSQVPTSPRQPGISNIVRKQNETTPVKAPKKQPKKNYQVTVPPRPPLAAGLAQLTQNLKPIDTSQVTAKICESPMQGGGDDWSDDGSTTVSIPNSPSRSEDEDLEEMIRSNQFKMKISEDFAKFKATPIKSSGTGVKREAVDHQISPRKKPKHEKVEEIVNEVNNENNAESANIKKKDVVLKKPQASLLQTYNQTWKHAHNHFMRHSDVRVREDRAPNVMDLANQPRVAQRVEGWKTHLISSEITELINDETKEMDKLNDVLKKLETRDSIPENEKISELIKGSMQRSRLVVESLNESRTQLLKIFDHKDHASEIITRCASKRNFKKR